MKKLLSIILLVVFAAGPACAQYSVGELQVSKNLTFTTSNEHAIRFTRPTTGPGTVAITNGGETVTGTGTKFREWFSCCGVDTITVNGVTRTVLSIESDTSLTIQSTWTASLSGQTYTLNALTTNSYGILPNGTLRFFHDRATLLFQEPTGGNASLSKILFRTEDGAEPLNILQTGRIISKSSAEFGDGVMRAVQLMGAAYSPVVPVWAYAGSGTLLTVGDGRIVAIQGQLTSGTTAGDGNAAVRGWSNSSAATTGVYGESDNGKGVYGTSNFSNAAHFQSGGSANTASTLVLREHASGQTTTVKLLDLRNESDATVMSVDMDGKTGIGAAPETNLTVSKSASGAVGPVLYLDNPATSAANNAASIVFGTSSGANPTTTRTGYINSVVTTAGTGASALVFGGYNGSAEQEFGRFSSTGALTVASSISERGRSVAMGDWTAVAFNAANFTGSGSMTVTLTSGDQVTYEYERTGLSGTVNFYLTGISVGGTVSNEILVALPAGTVPASSLILPILYQDNGGTMTAGYCLLSAGSSSLRIRKIDASNWTLATNTTSIYGSIRYQVQP